MTTRERTMPIVIPCNQCKSPLALRPEVLGRMVRCPACLTTFVAQAPDESSPRPVLSPIRVTPPPPREPEPSADECDARYDSIADQPAARAPAGRPSAPWAQAGNEEDEVYRRPWRQRSPRRSSSARTGWLIGLGVALP